MFLRYKGGAINTAYIVRIEGSLAVMHDGTEVDVGEAVVERLDECVPAQHELHLLSFFMDDADDVDPDVQGIVSKIERHPIIGWRATGDGYAPVIPYGDHLFPSDSWATAILYPNNRVNDGEEILLSINQWAFKIKRTWREKMKKKARKQKRGGRAVSGEDAQVSSL